MAVSGQLSDIASIPAAVTYRRGIPFAATHRALAFCRPQLTPLWGLSEELMRTLVVMLAAVTIAPPSLAAEMPRFEAQTIDRTVGEVCYALAVADVDGDGSKDVVAATENAIRWYVNPRWDRRSIVEGTTPPDNVCLEARDFDGDGRVDFAVGSGWGPLGLRGTEALYLVGRARGSDRWRVRAIGPVPSLHRLRAGNVGGPGRLHLVAAPLQGRGVREPLWGDGPGVRILAFEVPALPASDDWASEVVDEGLHTVHGLEVVDLDGDGRDEVLVAAWEGIFLLRRDAAGRWSRSQIGTGDQRPGPSRGASEVRLGRLADGRRYVVAVEPWHGHQVVAYTPPTSGRGLWDRHLVDADVSGGHALVAADLDGDGDDELAVARRDADHDLGRPPNAMGVLVYDPAHAAAGPLSFKRHVIDEGGIAAEDLVAADLDGDGRVDLVAGGRETHNLKIYWNRAASR